MANAPHVCAERVRWADVDLVGIARFSAFTRFVEHGEQEWLRAAGLPYREIFNAPSIWMPRRHMSIDYFAPARLDDALALVTYVPRIGTTSFTFNVDVLGLADGAPRASASVVVVCVNVEDFAKRPLPRMVLDAIAPFHLDRDAALEAATAQRQSLAELAIFQ
jgi:YbgC/YbaW family acyl-CoA thioester hydrolase